MLYYICITHHKNQNLTLDVYVKTSLSIIILDILDISIVLDHLRNVSGGS